MEADRLGFLISEDDLRAQGFEPLTLEFRACDLVLPDGPACEWTTSGDVPKGPGLYAFTVGDGSDLAVLYVGLTQELWMITKGRTPDGKARPGQRYGRPRYAGVTRQRVNVLIAGQLALGREVRHWVRPLVAPSHRPDELRDHLLSAEAELIDRWRLKSLGWNRR